MKRITANVTATMVAILILTAASFAQQKVKATVPFEFNVGQKTLSAGEYTVAPIATNVLALRDSNNSVVAMFITEPMLTLAQDFNPKLKFQMTDGRYFLSEVWADASTGYGLSVPKPLRVIAQTQFAGTEMSAYVSASSGK